MCLLIRQQRIEQKLASMPKKRKNDQVNPIIDALLLEENAKLGNDSGMEEDGDEEETKTGGVPTLLL